MSSAFPAAVHAVPDYARFYADFKLDSVAAELAGNLAAAE